MVITPLAAESMGSRSMAVFIETEKTRILIDPGAGISELRFGYKPHPLENWILKKHLDRIRLFMQKADMVIITHFHANHFISDSPELYRDKLLFVKNPTRKIGIDQRNRGFQFIKSIQGVPKDINYIDGRKFMFENLELRFSDPAVHSGDEDSGYVVIPCVISNNYTFEFIADIEQLGGTVADDFIIKNNPDFCYFDGPVSYFYDDISRKSVMNEYNDVIRKIMKNTKVSEIIIDHHLLRDILWRENIKSLLSFAEDRDVNIQTAAEFRGEENNLLEARRDRLY